MHCNMKKELTKVEFKKMYMNYRTDGDGWSDEYWEHFYEKLDANQYFFTEPETPEHTRMFISEGQGGVHLFFVTLDGEEGFSNRPPYTCE